MPGTYTVTFTLTGFSNVKREGVELVGSFAATVNADMKVGNVAETITVSGEAPIVDVQSTTKQTVITHQELDSLLGSIEDRMAPASECDSLLEGAQRLFEGDRALLELVDKPPQALEHLVEPLFRRHAHESRGFGNGASNEKPCCEEH